jgi:hypothetical protein
MGADYTGQEKGIENLRQIPEEARKYLSHHFRNSMHVVAGNILLAKSCLSIMEIEEAIIRLSEAEHAANHLLRDLKKIGC